MGDQVRGLEAALRRAPQLQVDADWVPGQPYVRQEWDVAEAWDALLTHLGQYGAEARVDGGEIRTVRGAEETLYRIDPEEWAASLEGPGIDPPEDSEVVPDGWAPAGPRRTDVHRQETHR